MPAYTTLPLDRAQITSQSFRDHGIINGAPAQVSQLKATLLTGENSAESFGMRPILPIYAGLFLLGQQEIAASAFVNAMKGSTKVAEIFPRPPLVVATTGKTSEAVQNELTTLGFLPQSSQRYQFYSGPANDDTLRRVMGLSVNTNAYSPYGTANVLGHLTLGMCTRIIHAASLFQGNWSLKWPIMKTEGDEDGERTISSEIVCLPDVSKLRPFITKEEDLPENGIFFQYFDGLILPDKSFVPSYICNTFQQILGDNAASSAACIKTIFDGWSSLSTTPAGVQISHLVFGMDLALQGRTRVRPVVLSRTYSGFMLEGKKIKVFLGPQIISPDDRDSLTEQVKAVDQHALSLIELSLLLSDQPIHGGEKKNVTDDMLQSPRALHNHLRVRDFSVPEQEKIRGLVNKLNYPQTFWEVTDNRKVAVAIQNMIDRSFLEDAPFAYKAGGVLFTKDPIFSTLAAFGMRAPTLTIEKGGNLPIALKGDASCYKKNGKVHLDGIPYYTAPLQQAFELWNQTLKTMVVNIRQSGNDKKGNAKLPGSSGIIPFDNPAAVNIFKSIGDKVKEEKAEGKGKRKANDEPEAPAVKKKQKKSGLADFLPVEPEHGAPAGPSGGNDDDEMEDFW